jgi:hypothetical protein
MKKSKDLLEGRTKEWDTKDWQGRSERQIQVAELLAGYAFIGFFIVILGLVIWEYIKTM